MSYEVELTAKSVSRYESIIRIYRMIHQCDLVYWLVGSDEVKSQILKAKELVREPKDNFHVFVDHAEYMKSGWKSIARNSQGDPLFTVEENLWGLLGDKPRICQSLSEKLIADPNETLKYRNDRRIMAFTLDAAGLTTISGGGAWLIHHYFKDNSKDPKHALDSKH